MGPKLLVALLLVGSLWNPADSVDVCYSDTTEGAHLGILDSWRKVDINFRQYTCLWTQESFYLKEVTVRPSAPLPPKNFVYNSAEYGDRFSAITQSLKQTLVNMGLIDNVWNMYPYTANRLNGNWVLAFNGESLEGKQGEMSIDDFLMTTLRDSTKVDSAFLFSVADVEPFSTGRHRMCGITFVLPEDSVEQEVTNEDEAMDWESTLPPENWNDVCKNEIVFIVHVETEYTPTANFNGNAFCQQVENVFISRSLWFGRQFLYCRSFKDLNHDRTLLAEIHLNAENLGYTHLIPSSCSSKLRTRVATIFRGAGKDLGEDWKHLKVTAIPQVVPMREVTTKELAAGTINPICLKVADETNLVTRVSGHISADSTILTDMKLSGPQQMHTLCKEFLDDEFQHVLRGDSPYRTTELLSCNQDDGSFVYQMAYSCTDDQESCEKPIKDILQELTEVVEDGEQSFNKVCQVWPKDIDELVVYLTVSKEETTVRYDAVESLKKRLRRSRVLHSTISAQFDDTSPLSPSKPQAVRLAFDYFMLSELAGSINFENVKTFAENKLAGGEFQQLNDSYKFTLQGMSLDTVTLDCGAPIADDPSAPQNLRVVKVTKHGVKLSWEAPADDGGSPITQYVIRFWPADASTPQQVGRTAELEAFVDQVVQGSSGGFDVGAVNVGQTPVSWSGRTDIMDVSEPAVEPRIFRPVDALNPEDEGVGGLKSVTLKSGESLRLAAAWFGNPIPQVVWRRDHVEIRESDGYSFSREEAPIAADLGRFEQREQPESGTAVLAFSGVTRRNRGRYELVLTNSVGTVTSECDVEVIDVPGISGELSAKVTAPTSVQLEWNAPGDDGGRAIEVYVVEKRLEGNAEWELVELVDSRRRSVTDTDLQPGKKYEFRVAARNSLGVGQAVYTNEPVLVRFEDSTVCLANSPGPSVISLASTKYIGDDGRELFLDCACADEDVIDEVESYLQTPPRET